MAAGAIRELTGFVFRNQLKFPNNVNLFKVDYD